MHVANGGEAVGGNFPVSLLAVNGASYAPTFEDTLPAPPVAGHRVIIEYYNMFALRKLFAGGAYSARGAYIVYSAPLDPLAGGEVPFPKTPPALGLSGRSFASLTVTHTPSC